MKEGCSQENGGREICKLWEDYGWSSRQGNENGIGEMNRGGCRWSSIQGNENGIGEMNMGDVGGVASKVMEGEFVK
jgi:hypothetical protein